MNVHYSASARECPEAPRTEKTMWSHVVEKVTCPTCKPRKK